LKIRKLWMMFDGGWKMGNAEWVAVSLSSHLPLILHILFVEILFC